MVAVHEEHAGLWFLFQELKAKGPSLASSAFDAVIARYSESHRGYHNVEHLEDLGDHFLRHKDKWGTDWQAVIAAIFYHDVIYDAQPGEDEKRSAEFARAELEKMGVDAECVTRAVEMIEATASHDSDDPVVQLFLDMDMSILAAEALVYDSYVEGVAQEFCTKHGIQRDVFDKARLEFFLEPVLAKGTIFKTPEYQALEPQAFVNMQREVKNIHSKISPYKPEELSLTVGG